MGRVPPASFRTVGKTAIEREGAREGGGGRSSAGCQVSSCEGLCERASQRGSMGVCGVKHGCVRWAAWMCAVGGMDVCGGQHGCMQWATWMCAVGASHCCSDHLM